MKRDLKAKLALLSGVGITPAEWTLFHIINYGMCMTVEDLPKWAAGAGYGLEGTENTLEECETALRNCLSKGWLQVINAETLRRIKSELQEQQIFGPISGLPCDQVVDFTEVGARLWRESCGHPKTNITPRLFAYTRVVHEKVAYYFPSEKAALSELERIRIENADVIETKGPYRIGAWRLQWWRRFSEGYRIEVESRYNLEGGSHSSGAFLEHSDRWQADPQRLQKILERHLVTYAEWLLLAEAEYTIHTFPRAMLDISKKAVRNFGMPASEDDCKFALQSCLEKGWLRVVDDAYALEIDTLIQNDSSNAPIINADARKLGKPDFTLTGAALYRKIAEEYVGLDWEDDLLVSQVYYRVEHRYCETIEGIDHAIREYTLNRKKIRQSRVFSIGPWCVSWWERFPSGYRLEVEIGEP